MKMQTARKELHITAIFGAIFLVVVGGFTPYSVVRSIDRRYEFDADIYLAVSVFGALTTSGFLSRYPLSVDVGCCCTLLL